MEQQQTAQETAGKPEGQRLYLNQPGFQLTVSLSADEMVCLAHLERKETGDPLRLDDLYDFLAANGITTGIDQQAAEQLIIDAYPGAGASATLARGTAPISGADGELIYNIIPLERTASQIDADDEAAVHVDFHSVQQFVNVEPEQEFARILPPSPGTPGSTVRGAAVPAPPGKPLSLTCGEHCHFGGDDNSLLISEIHGRVKLEGDSVTVVEEYVVDGDVDFSVGNIHFNGFVEIHGDVLDGFQISASKGLKISGNVGVCRLISHGNIEFCGMDGQGSGSIICGGALTANFIHGTQVECWWPMLVHVELRDCTVTCGGVLSAGMITGGSSIALGGVTTKRIGSPSGQKTLIHAGVDYRDQQRLRELIAQVTDIHETLAHTLDAEEQQHLQAEKQRLAACVVQLRNQRPPGSNAKVNVRKQLYEGVTVQLGNAIEEFSSLQEGPFSLIENSIDGGLRKLELTGLEIPAEQVERAYLEQEALCKPADDATV